MAYIYGHYKADTGELFYIGKGTGKRAWKKSSRSTYWRNIVNKHGYTVQILEDGLTEDQAYAREKELIAEVGMDTLANFRVGGDNPTSADVKRLYENEEYRTKVTNMLRKRNVEQSKNPDWLVKVTEANRLLAKSEEHRKKISDAIKKKYEDPVYREKRRVPWNKGKSSSNPNVPAVDKPN